jgi:S1-C subfamily serine protease
VDGQRIGSATDLKAALAPKRPGDTVSVTWTGADGTSQTSDITLGEGPVG